MKTIRFCNWLIEKDCDWLASIIFSLRYFVSHFTSVNRHYAGNPDPFKGCPDEFVASIAGLFDLVSSEKYKIEDPAFYSYLKDAKTETMLRDRQKGIEHV
ncbi:MAG TPA: hypothetical protein VFM18_24205 [Methanosarcina sp.]|nr:hypothetical protein [Methanosarcina sp.]